MNTQVKKRVDMLLGHKEGAVILEIGSHYGEDTIDMRKVFNNPNIFCFDPHPGNAEYMRRHFGMKSIVESPMGGDYYSDDNGKIFLYEMALSNFDGFGRVDFNVIVSPLSGGKPLPTKYSWMNEDDYRSLGLNDSGGSSLKNGYRNEDCKKVSVATTRLDRWALQSLKASCVDFIWMDVQGAEKDVIEGGNQTLAFTKYMWLECGEICYDGGMLRQETVDLLAPLNFYVIGGDRENLLMENKCPLER